MPIFLDEYTNGHLLLEYYGKHTEIGTGIDLNYRVIEGSAGGHFSFFRLVGLGESYSIDWRDSFRLNETTSLSLATGLRSGSLQDVSAQLRTGAILTGRQDEWGWSLSFNRDQNLISSDADEEELQGLQYLLLERFPELAIARSGIDLGEVIPLNLSTSFQWGRYREEAIGGDMSESSRVDGAISAQIDPIKISDCDILEQTEEPLDDTDSSELAEENSGERDQPEPECGSLTASVGYRISDYDQTKRESWDVASGINLRLFNALNISANYGWRQIKGSSPFQFDQLQTSNSISARASAKLSGSVGVQLNSGYDWIQKAYAPLRMGLAYDDADYHMCNSQLSMS